MVKFVHSPGSPPRFSAKILIKIFRLAIICPRPLRIDAVDSPDYDEPFKHDKRDTTDELLQISHSPKFNSPVLRLSRGTYNELIDYFYKHNTFCLCRSSICQYKSPLRFSMTISQRLKVRNLLLTSFGGTLACHRLAIGIRKPYANNGPAKSCENCDPARLPDLGTLFPNAKLITIDYAATHNSRIVFEQFCKAIVTQRGNQYLCPIGVGESVLCGTTTSSATIVFEDRRLRQIWRTLVTIDPKSLYRRACLEVLAMKRLSLRTTEMILRLLDFYDHECDFLLMAGDASGTRLPSDLRGEQKEMSGAFLTALNWALREYLRIRDSLFVRALEGGGLRGVMEARKLERALLEALGSIPKWSLAREDKKIIKMI